MSIPSLSPCPLPLEILLVDDDPAQVYLVRMALRTWKTPYNLRVASDAEEAIELINSQNGYSGSPRPHLALLDLNLPKQGGLFVLKTIKEDPSTRHIAVVVLTSSVAVSDLQSAFDLHANAYFQKPISYDGIEELFQTLEAFCRLDARFRMRA